MTPKTRNDCLLGLDVDKRPCCTTTEDRGAREYRRFKLEFSGPLVSDFWFWSLSPRYSVTKSLHPLLVSLPFCQVCIPLSVSRGLNIVLNVIIIGNNAEKFLIWMRNLEPNLIASRASTDRSRTRTAGPSLHNSQNKHRACRVFGTEAPRPMTAELQAVAVGLALMTDPWWETPGIILSGIHFGDIQTTKRAHFLEQGCLSASRPCCHSVGNNDEHNDDDWRVRLPHT